MKAIIVARPITGKESKEIQRVLRKEKDCQLFAKPDLLPVEMNPRPYREIDAEEKRRINFEVMQAVLDFGELQVGDQTIARLFTLEKAGIWFYHKFRTYFLVRNLSYELQELKNMGREFTEVIVYPENSLSAQSGLLPGQFVIRNNHQAKGWRPWRSYFSYTLVAGIRILQGFFQQTYRFKGKHLFIDSREQDRKILHLDGVNTTIDNAYWGYAFQQKNLNVQFIDQLVMPKFTAPFPFRFEYFRNYTRRSRINGEYIVLRGILSGEARKELLQHIRRLQELYILVEKNTRLDGLTLLMFRQLKSLHSSSVFYLVKYVAYRQYFINNYFRSVTTTDENSPNIKIILDAAKSLSVVTISYQHGSVHTLNPNYLYNKSEMEVRIRPVPDHNLVWGQKWKELMVNDGNYLPDSIRVIGQIRTDIISHLKENLKDYRHHYFPDAKNSRLLTFASQPLRDQKLRYRAAEDVIAAASRFDNVYLVIKLHPYEKDVSFYNSIAQKLKFSRLKIVQDFDLYLLLHLSDIVVTCFSTVGSETVYFYKPLIILDHLKQDILNFKKEGVAFQASNVDELAEILKGLADGTLTFHREAYERYIRNYAYRIDGQAGQRLIDFVTSF